MIGADEVYNAFLELIAPEGTDATDRVMSLCVSSLIKLYSMMRSDANRSDMRIAYAAACDAYYDYVLSKISDAEESSDFKAGDVTVKANIKDTLSVAQKIKENGENAVRDLLRDDSFGAWSI